MRYLLLLCLCFSFLSAQEKNKAIDSIILLDNIQLEGNRKIKVKTDTKMSVSVDEYLSTQNDISFIKRGAYAWEPQLNNLSSERSNITIDGMHIFGACTDKMDPVTTYVESNNLSKVEINSGQKGSMHGSAITGSIDLMRNSTRFSAFKVFKKTLQSGYEFNNQHFFNMANFSYSANKIAVDGSLSLRNAKNYSDGKGNEIKHSQFNKINASLGLSYKTSPLSSLHANVIFDKAKDVGYPALPMDLWLSRALITSLSYRKLFKDNLIHAWDTKLYFNAIEHYMDDTTRPENLVHMDMPGWSTTFGLQSKLNIEKRKFNSQIQLNAYNNLSIAEMTMYPQDRSEVTMFAYTWPWVSTSFANLSINNTYLFEGNSKLNFSGAIGMNHSHSKYVEFNRIFHPEASQQKTRLLPSLQANYQVKYKHLTTTIGIGYGQRAPTVSEAYGYYIYNSFDRYDYIGNPNLSNEVSYELNASIAYKFKKFRLEIQSNYFLIDNYIIGEILNLGSPMNYQSIGVKAYTTLNYATLFNFSLNAKYSLLNKLHWATNIRYARGKTHENTNLPFIRPLSYNTSLHYGLGKLNIQTSVKGDFKQRNFSSTYGEDATASFIVWDLSADYSFYIGSTKSTLQIGVENLLNEYYSTYADWGNIPRMGRNLFTTIKIKL